MGRSGLRSGSRQRLLPTELETRDFNIGQQRKGDNGGGGGRGGGLSWRDEEKATIVEGRLYTRWCNIHEDKRESGKTWRRSTLEPLQTRARVSRTGTLLTQQARFERGRISMLSFALIAVIIGLVRIMLHWRIMPYL